MCVIINGALPAYVILREKVPANKSHTPTIEETIVCDLRVRGRAQVGEKEIYPARVQRRALWI
jgi:hypothetical protein